MTHCGEKVEEWQGGKIAIYHIELQFNSIQLNFIAIPLNLSQSTQLRYTEKQEKKSGMKSEHKMGKENLEKWTK